VKTKSNRFRARLHAKAKPGNVIEGSRGFFGNEAVKVEVDERSTATPYGGLALFHTLARRLRLDRMINGDLILLKLPLPYWESDHVLTHVYNLLSGGTCIEDIANLQNSEAVRRMLGAARIPDPTTAGDFLRRFVTQGSLSILQKTIDRARVKVWKKVPKKKRRRATIDMDSHIREVYGECKQGADFSYTGKWSYHPLIATLAETGEWLRVVNRPGNTASPEGALKMLAECLDLTAPYFEERIWRGDTAFYEAGLINMSVQRGAHFVVGVDAMANLVEIAQKLPPRAWKAMEWRPEEEVIPEEEQRQKRFRWREFKARQRGYRDIQSREQNVAEFAYQPTNCDREYRMIVRRVKIRETKGQQVLFEGYRYYFQLTDIGRWTPEEVVRFGYGRCDIENDIEQQENGIAAMKMPTGELLANAAYLLMAELAWNLRAWASLLLLPEETGTWEWKRFRHAFVYVGAKVIRQARQVVAKISGAHRYAEDLLRAINRVTSMVFSP
jgi:hypothetical protein